MMFQTPSVTRPSSAEITPTADVAATLARAANPAPLTRSAKRAIAETLGQRPLGFERNQGQFDAATRFAARGANYGIYLDDADVTLAFHRKDNERAAALRMSVVGAKRSSSRLVASDPLPGVIRHYRGAEAKPESLAVETHVLRARDAHQRARRRRSRVLRQSAPPRIRLRRRPRQGPARDSRAVRRRAQRRSRSRSTGDLLLHVDGGDPVRQHKPVTYQVIDGTRHDVDSRYVIDANAQVGFEVGTYDAAQPLVIDPVLTYSTYFGNGSEELISDIALDAAGNIYVTGITTRIGGSSRSSTRSGRPSRATRTASSRSSIRRARRSSIRRSSAARRTTIRPSTTAGSRSTRRATPTSPAARSPPNFPTTRQRATTRRSTVTRRPATATPTSRS